ncbi:MAG: hypothetical protein AAGA68_22715 [Pseudomonadota bacterium]
MLEALYFRSIWQLDWDVPVPIVPAGQFPIILDANGGDPLVIVAGIGSGVYAIGNPQQ